jgi:RNA polymerase sigma-70 factor (ECF subfamily)
MQRPAETLAAHHSWLRRVARRMANSSASADDLVQDTCMTALQNAPEDAEMRPWLRSVMRKLAWGQSRADRRRAQREAISHVYTPPSSDPDPLLAYGVDRQRLTRAIEALPEPFRSTIVQRYIEGRSCVEIAGDEQVPASTVRTRQQRALELLRGELEGQAGRRRARRRHLFWWLPLAGSGERIVARLGDGLVALLGQSKATWLVIVVLAAALGLVALRDAAQRQRAGGSQPATAHAHQVAGASLHAPGRGQGQQPGRAELLLTHGVPRPGRSAPGFPADASHAGRHRDIEPDERRERRRSFEALRHQYEPHLDDCELDANGFVRCDKPPTLLTNPGRPTCDFINGNVAFIDINRRFNFMTRTHANRFLTAAMLANLALGTNLGCSLITDTGGAGGSKTKVVGGGEDCVTLEGPNGQPCTTCTDPSGAETTMCAPADCYVETMPDGAICTTCTDLEGNAKTLCADAPPQDCVSEMPEIGRVCTTCNVDGQPETTCASAQCSVSDRCLVCQDPRGFTASDCSIDYEVLPTYGSSVGSADGLISCNSSAGYPAAATTSCDYPGLSSCTLTDGCVECRSPWGGGVGRCPFDPEDLLPEIFSGRPANLPEPGTCVEKTSPDGDMVCTTCTRGDLSASTHCRHPEALRCDPFLSEDNLVCVSCRHADGSDRTYCEPAS